MTQFYMPYGNGEERRPFHAVLSHEVRTLLTSIIGFSELLLLKKTGNWSQETLRYLHLIREAGLKLELVLSGFFENCTLDDKYCNRVVSVSELANSCKRAVASKAKSAGVNLVFEIPPEAAGAFVPQMLLAETLTGLLLLVIEKTAPGGKVGLRCSLSEEKLLFSVWRTFSPGWQAGEYGCLRLPGRDSESEKVLVLARELSRLRGGCFWVEGTLGTVSSFCLLIPAEPKVELLKDRETV
ncbi:MAG: histidine kinase dimerization/phospho-acceptor domain-containing protein [Bacillota bacterium]